MSPFQQDVIDTTLADFDRQAAMGRQSIRDAAKLQELLVAVEKVLPWQSLKLVI